MRACACDVTTRLGSMHSRKGGEHTRSEELLGQAGRVLGYPLRAKLKQ